MKLTKEKLKNLNPCSEGFEWYINHGKTDLLEICNGLVDDNHADWANWTITNLMTKDQCVRYAIFAAEQVIDIFEKKYSGDDRPRWAIESAKKYLKTRGTAAAWAARAAAWAASGAASGAAGAAWAAAWAAWAASGAARAAARDATRAAWDATRAAWAASGASNFKTMQKKIIAYGVQILEVKDA